MRYPLSNHRLSVLIVARHLYRRRKAEVGEIGEGRWPEVVASVGKVTFFLLVERHTFNKRIAKTIYLMDKLGGVEIGNHRLAAFLNESIQSF